MQQRLFHISQESDIAVFHPRTSPSFFESITSDVVFAVSERLIHNYLLPRECPRVTYYAGDATSKADAKHFLPPGSDYVVAVEHRWLAAIVTTRLFCYEFPADGFRVLDEGAGYYVSEQAVVPSAVTVIEDIPEALFEKGVELRFVRNLWPLAEAVKKSSMQFSLIRMRNAFGK